MTITPYNEQPPNDPYSYCEYCGKELEVWRHGYQENYMFDKSKGITEIVLMCLNCTIDLHNKGDLTKVENPYYYTDGSISVGYPFRYEFTKYRLDTWQPH